MHVKRRSAPSTTVRIIPLDRPSQSDHLLALSKVRHRPQGSRDTNRFALHMNRHVRYNDIFFEETCETESYEMRGSVITFNGADAQHLQSEVEQCSDALLAVLLQFLR